MDTLGIILIVFVLGFAVGWVSNYKRTDVDSKQSDIDCKNVKMKEPNFAWKTLFKSSVKYRMEQGFNYLHWDDWFTPAEKAWIEREFPEFTLWEDDLDEAGCHSTVFFKKVRNHMEAIECVL